MYPCGSDKTYKSLLRAVMEDLTTSTSHDLLLLLFVPEWVIEGLLRLVLIVHLLLLLILIFIFIILVFVFLAHIQHV